MEFRKLNYLFNHLEECKDFGSIPPLARRNGMELGNGEGYITYCNPYP